MLCNIIRDGVKTMQQSIESHLLCRRSVVAYFAWDERVKKVVYRNNGLQNGLHTLRAHTFVEMVILNVIGQLQKSLVSLKL